MFWYGREYVSRRIVFSEVRYNSLKRLFEKQISAVILTRNSNASAEMLKLAEEFETPVLRTSQPTSSLQVR